MNPKYQAKRRGDSSGNKLVSSADTPGFVAELAPVDNLADTTLRSLIPISRPVRGNVLSVRALYARLLGLVGREMEYSTSERLRGERLHRLACETLTLGSYADTGKFPDILCQAVEVKLQTSPTTTWDW